jgi:hypothetical protein
MTVKRKSKRTRQSSWSRTMTKLPALTVWQPWAWLIVSGYKDVENRSWATRHRGSLLIHAGLNKFWLTDTKLARIERKYRITLPRDFKRGGAVGIVEVTDCVRRSRSRWHQRGSIGWALRNPRLLPFRHCKGAMSLFRPKFSRRDGPPP